MVSQNGEPRIRTNLPSAMVADHEVVIEIKISKAEISGFATFQLDLPQGFVSREIESAEANVSIEEGLLIWNWEELQESEEITLSVGITPSALAIGNHRIGGSFYYLEDNEKKSKDLARLEVSVQKEGEELETASKTTPSENSNAEPAGLISIDKSIENSNLAKEKIINIKITKGITKGFARYSDNLEEGFSARAVKTDGSSFSIADGKIKFVWVNVPEKEELMISYILIQKSTISSLNLKGEYSYLEHNQSKKVLAPEQNISFEEGTEKPIETPVAEVQPKIEETSTSKPEPVIEPVKESLAKQSIKKQNQPIFAIQIGAFTNSKVSSQKLKSRFKVKESIRSEFQEGYSKFMIGSLEEYKKARDKREQTVNGYGIKSAFVVAYHNGKRITVQEALMTLNQKWFK